MAKKGKVIQKFGWTTPDPPWLSTAMIKSNSVAGRPIVCYFLELSVCISFA